MVACHWMQWLHASRACVDLRILLLLQLLLLLSQRVLAESLQREATRFRKEVSENMHTMLRRNKMRQTLVVVDSLAD